MDTDKHRLNLPEGEITHAVIGAAFEVLNELGHGLHEKPYENALGIELALRHLPCDNQANHEILYKGHVVVTFVPDLIVAQKVVVDTNVIDFITYYERGQMLNYLRITKLKVGLIINFKKPRLEWERTVL